LPSLYQDICDFTIKEAEPGEPMLPETIYIAPPDYHLAAEKNGTLSLSAEAAVNFSRPSIDITLESMAQAYGTESLGILLTGANHDGALGMMSIHDHGGITVVQDPKFCEYPTMPESCLSKFKPDYVLKLDEISNSIASWNFDRRLKWTK
jgi:two-component system chemotaxis response regulator CheB